MDAARISETTDDELLVAVGRGDRDAFSELYDRYAPFVLARMMQLSADRPSAESMVVEVFLEFWRQAPRLDRVPTSVAA